MSKRWCGAAARVRGLPQPMLDEGLPPEAITAFVTGVNDLVTTRLIELIGLDGALRDAGACWIVLGSAGRGEQTLATDQDNAHRLRRRDRSRGAAARAPAARRTRERGARPERLSALPRRGDGGQPALVPVAVRVARVLRGLDRPARAGGAAERRDLLRLPRASTAIGDLVAGAARLARRLRARTAAGSCFLMVQNALGNQPPLGLVRDFALARGGEHAGHARPQGERRAAVRRGGADLRPGRWRHRDQHARTAGRRRSARARFRRWSSTPGPTAFRFIQRLRLGLNAAQQARGEPLHNHLDPATLTDADRRGLKQALRAGAQLAVPARPRLLGRRRRLRRLIQRDGCAATSSLTLASNGRSGLP